MGEDWHSLSEEKVLRILKTSEEGLSQEEAERRLAEYGPNVIREEEERFKTLKMFLEQFKDAFVLMLIAASIISVFIGEVVDAITIGAIVFLCAITGFVQEYRAEKALEALRKYVVPVARVVRDGEVKVIPASQLVPGDVILLEEGDRVPADARLIKCFELATDEAPLTGESTPVEKSLGVLPPETPVADRHNMVFMGTHVVRGRGVAVVVATGMNTEFGKIAKAMAEVKREKTPLQAKLDRFAARLAKIVVALCIVIFVLDLFRYGFSSDIVLRSFMLAVALAVSAVPEALPAVVTITLALGARELAKRNAIIRRLASAETFGSVTYVCADKTGTLTKGEMEVRKIYANGKFFDLEAMADNDGLSGPDAECVRLALEIGCLCNNAIKGENGVKGDPTEVALIISAERAGLRKEELETEKPRVYEIPFSSERKRMTTIHKRGDGSLVAYVKGAPEVVLERCSHILLDGQVKELTDEMRARVLKANEEMAMNALRVLAMAYKPLPDDLKEFEPEVVENDLIFVGLQGMIDPPRPEAIEAVKACERAGMKNVMITGDHKLTAVAIAKELGILKEGSKVLTGPELDAMSDGEFEAIVEDVVVYARVSPIHKLRIVEALKKKGHIVAMTGDGVNDAPALKKADVGVAMGIKGTDVTKEAADMILVDDNYATLVNALIYGRQIYDNIRKYIRLLMSCNFDELFVLATAALLGFPPPMRAAQILWINLVTDGPPAIALGTDPPEKGIETRPPRDPKAGIFHGMLLFMVISFLAQAIGGLSLFFYGYLVLGDYKLAITMVFVQAALFELFVAWNCRSETHSVWRMGKDALRNKFFILADIACVALTLALPYIPVLGPALHCVPLSLPHLLLTVAVASTGLFVILPELWMRSDFLTSSREPRELAKP